MELCLVHNSLDMVHELNPTRALVKLKTNLMVG